MITYTVYIHANYKPAYDFLFVIYDNLYPISHHFQDIADYWSNLHSLWHTWWWWSP